MNIELALTISLTLTIGSFGFLAMRFFRLYREKSEKILSNPSECDKYQPKKAFSKILIFVVMAVTPIVYILLEVLLPSETTNSTGMDMLTYSMLMMGFSGLIVNVAWTIMAPKVVEDLVHVPIYPADMPEITPGMKIEAQQEIYEKKKEFLEKNDLHKGSFNFGRHLCTFAIYSTLLVYSLLIFVFVWVAVTPSPRYQEVYVPSQAMVNSFANAVVIYIALGAVSILGAVKTKDIPMDFKNFGKNVLYHFVFHVPSILGLFLLIMTIMPLLE